MKDRLQAEWPRQLPSVAERRRLAIAQRQLEWSDVYLVAITNLELEDSGLRRSVHELRAMLGDVERRMRSLQEP